MAQTPVIRTTDLLDTFGLNTLGLGISQDSWNGSATYVVTVDGKQVGGTLTAHAGSQ